MASVSVSVDLPISPGEAWAKLTDLGGWSEWLVIHQAWKGVLPEPSEIRVGTQITQVVAVMGMANKIDWTINEFNAPKTVTIAGTGMAGVQIEFTLRAEPVGTGTSATIDASFTGAMIVGPIGKAVAKSAQADLAQSLATLAELLAA
ncbi:MAG TPA: SRPBCC family protein [Pseudonocardiaceae bacterium]|jgi:hypothetical protein|nr:SRPBCC family protein [Pseudonocardiaceae bacterium]